MPNDYYPPVTFFGHAFTNLSWATVAQNNESQNNQNNGYVTRNRRLMTIASHKDEVSLDTTIAFLEEIENEQLRKFIKELISIQDNLKSELQRYDRDINLIVEPLNNIFNYFKNFKYKDSNLNSFTINYKLDEENKTIIYCLAKYLKRAYRQADGCKNFDTNAKNMINEMLRELSDAQCATINILLKDDNIIELFYFLHTYLDMADNIDDAFRTYHIAYVDFNALDNDAKTPLKKVKPFLEFSNEMKETIKNHKNADDVSSMLAYYNI